MAFCQERHLRSLWGISTSGWAVSAESREEANRKLLALLSPDREEVPGRTSCQVHKQDGRPRERSSRVALRCYLPGLQESLWVVEAS